MKQESRMGWLSSERMAGGNHHRQQQQLRLEIKAPSFFRCPISLEVMRSPVSLCTGVTYDRSSIQRWLDSGNTTCPATMLPLPSTDLVPNLTLRRLINIWSSATATKDGDKGGSASPADLVSDLKSSPDPLPTIEKLAAFFADADIDDDVKNGVVNAGDFANVVGYLVVNRDGNELKLVEGAIEVVSGILNSDWTEERTKEIVISSLCSDLDACVTSLTAVLSRSGSRTNSAAKILRTVLSSTESKDFLPEKVDALIPELIELINSPSAVEDGLGCLIELLPSKRAMKTMVQFKLVPALVKILSPESLATSSTAAERAIVILEAAANCVAGRAAISETVEGCVQAVMGRMMKVGKGGREAAVGVLWGVCYSSGGDRRAKEAVAAVRGGMAKILVVMQGDCSPAVRQMAGDLLRVFRVDANSLVAGYDTNTSCHSENVGMEMMGGGDNNEVIMAGN